jgi:hypothetical protein
MHLNAKPPLSIVFAIPDHPWVDAVEGAAVRIAMTVGEGGRHDGDLFRVVSEKKLIDENRQIEFLESKGTIKSTLSVGVDVSSAWALKANQKLSCPGVKLHGSGFIVTPAQAAELGLGRIDGVEKIIRPYLNGRDITQMSRGVMVIDLYGFTDQQALNKYPEIYQWIAQKVKPERDANKDTKDGAGYAKYWWLFGKPRPTMRAAQADILRYIVTVETSKHRFFIFLDKFILPDNMLINVALEDAYFLGVLSSNIHVAWALEAGGRLGVGNDPCYNKTRCFETFPFPDPPEDLKTRIRDLGERLDAHRKRQQEQHPGLTMTGMYNVLEKLRAGEALSAKDREINDQGLVSVLREIHEELDTAVFEAYGWPPELSDEQILERLVALNQERVAEEAKGLVRWLRPEYQNPTGATQAQPGLAGIEVKTPTKAKIVKQPWPKTMAEQAQAVRQALATLGGPADLKTVAQCFNRANRQRLEELLQTLVGLGQAAKIKDGRYSAV